MLLVVCWCTCLLLVVAFCGDGLVGECMCSGSVISGYWCWRGTVMVGGIGL